MSRRNGGADHLTDASHIPLLIPVPAHPVTEGRVDGWEKPGVTAPTPHVEALQRPGPRGCAVRSVRASRG